MSYYDLFCPGDAGPSGSSDVNMFDVSSPSLSSRTSNTPRASGASTSHRRTRVSGSSLRASPTSPDPGRSSPPLSEFKRPDLLYCGNFARIGGQMVPLDTLFDPSRKDIPTWWKYEKRKWDTTIMRLKNDVTMITTECLETYLGNYHGIEPDHVDGAAKSCQASLTGLREHFHTAVEQMGVLSGMVGEARDVEKNYAEDEREILNNIQYLRSIYSVPIHSTVWGDPGKEVEVSKARMDVAISKISEKFDRIRDEVDHTRMHLLTEYQTYLKSAGDVGEGEPEPRVVASMDGTRLRFIGKVDRRGKGKARARGPHAVGPR